MAKQVNNVEVLFKAIEDTIGSSFSLPVFDRTFVDERRLLDLIEDLRSAIPKQVNDANEILMHRDKIMNDAREEAERIVREAQEQANQTMEETKETVQNLVDEQNIMQEAKLQVEGLRREADSYHASKVLEANEYAAETRASADAYAAETRSDADAYSAHTREVAMIYTMNMMKHVHGCIGNAMECMQPLLQELDQNVAGVQEAMDKLRLGLPLKAEEQVPAEAEEELRP